MNIIFILEFVFLDKQQVFYFISFKREYSMREFIIKINKYIAISLNIYTK